MRAAERPVPASERLQRYRDKRDFGATPEPAPEAVSPRDDDLQFVVQRHQARRLHYDFRLELDGVLLSWAVPKEPSLDPADKRLAVRTEDHPLAYAAFEGRIPEGHYGAGLVELWDQGRWRARGDPHEGLARGKLAFELDGQRLRGAFELVRTKQANGRQESWLLFKKREAAAAPPPAAALDLPTGPLPPRLAPQLASLAEASPATLARLDAEHWLLETKFDGYRVLARLEDGRARLFTRNGHDWTERMPLLAKALEALPVGSAWLDGEIVVPAQLDAQARGDFNALQNAFERGGVAASKAMLYWLFDVPWFEGHDLRETPLQSRRELLRQLLARSAPKRGKGSTDASPLRFSAEIEGDVEGALHAACAAGGEGVIAKRRDAPYRESRSDSWLKLKCRRRQEFVVVGYSPRSDDAQAVGSLSLAVYDEAGALVPAGRVGTGFSTATARALMRRLQPLREGRTATPQPVAPRCVVEVEFAEWTPAGQVRQASFVAVREDKPPEAIRREAAAPLPPPAKAAPAAKAKAKVPAGIRITHGERVIDARSGATKLDLVNHYDRVADAMLEELQGRAVALLRAPQGVGGETFFQKHAQAAPLPGVKVLDAKLWPGHEPLLEIRTREGLLGAAQMNVVEFHTWNSRTRSMAKPDRMVFDLDPGEGVAWAAVREGAQLVRAMLAELGLQAWLKTSGGKGLHVVVPIAARWPFDTVKGFSQAIVRHLAQTLPDRFVAKSGPKNRVGRIFVDYLRNGEGATTVAAYSARARPGLGVSMPLAWEALEAISGSAHWSVADAAAHLAARRDDPWAGIDAARQSLTAPMRRLGYRPA